jgi:hypothetical protein
VLCPFEPHAADLVGWRAAERLLKKPLQAAAGDRHRLENVFDLDRLRGVLADEAECLQDSECQGGFRCDDLRCVPIGGSSIECVGDADCRGGFRCASNRCVPIED